VATTDVIEEVRKEEQDLHKSIFTKIGDNLENFLRSQTNHSKVSAEDERDFDNTFADAFTLGDPVRKLADDETKLNDTICKVHKERGDKLLKYIRRKYMVHLITQISSRLVIRGFNIQNDHYCKDENSRKEYVRHANNLNAVQKQLQEVRTRLTDVFVHIGNASASPLSNLLPYFCCSWWEYKRDSAAAINQTDTKQFVENMIESYFGFGAKYLCVYHREGSPHCAKLESAIHALPASNPRPQGFLLPGVNCIARVTTIA